MRNKIQSDFSFSSMIKRKLLHNCDCFPLFFTIEKNREKGFSSVGGFRLAGVLRLTDSVLLSGRRKDFQYAKNKIQS
jgi:hypothetical protein